MDNLYADLENYNEVNIVDELRNENKELKLKLEEYETAIGKLQKDYDKLVLEFNSLQTNYSSLLITARAEVERKAQTITQLNRDKDMMILKTLQNGNNRVRNRFQNNNRNSGKSSNVENKVNVNKKMMNEQQHNTSNDKSDRFKANKSSNVSVTASDNTKLTDILDKVMKSANTCISKGELKENVSHCKPPHTDSPKTCSIKNRRKSMPAMNNPQFSTDEDCESDKPTTSTFINKLPPQVIATSTNTSSTKIGNERLSSKTSETTSMSERSSNNQELAKEGCKIETSRSSEPEKFTENDGIRGSHKFSDKTGGHDKLRESDRYRESDKFRVGYKDRKDIRQGEQTREGDTYREGDKYKEGNKYREAYKFRDSGKFREDVKFKESEKLRENEEHGEGYRGRQIDKYRLGDRNRESDKYREGYRESERFREYDRYRDSDKYKESDKYRIGDRNRDGDRFKEEDKYRDPDKFRGKEKFDPLHRHKRHYSPERSYKRNFREIQEDHRPEYRKYKVLSSPPPETQNVYQQRNQHHNLNSDVPRHKSDIHKSRHELRHTESLSLDNNDEPSRKRQKIDYDLPINDRRHDRNPVVRTSSDEYDLLRASCQSPDAVFSPETQPDSTLEHTIREIKNVAATPLEDPRVTSGKYVLHTENGTDKLSTALSKNIHIKPIDKSLWNIESVAIPDALLHDPQTQFSEETIKQMYMDIDNLESNVSVESGEIFEDALIESVNENDSRNHEGHKIDCNKTSTQKIKPKQIQKISEKYNTPKVPPSSKNNSNVTEDLGKNIAANKVSKIDQSASMPPRRLSHIDKAVNLVPNMTKNDLMNNQDLTTQSKPPQIDEVENLVHITTKTDVMDNKSSNTSQSRHPQIDVDKKLVPSTAKNDLLRNQSLTKLQSILPQIDDHKNLIPNNCSNENLYKPIKEDHTRISLSEMAMVQDDLELSDENSDNMEFHKHVATEQDVFRRTQATDEAKVSNTKCDFEIAPVIQDNVDNMLTDIKLKESHDHKKHKNKKSKTKSKEKDVGELNDVILTEKKTKSKKSKELKPKQNKNKFTDLFGDSSSLITPEDLGIPSTCVPLCEDAQDAVDIDMKEFARGPQNENLLQQSTKKLHVTQDCNVDRTKDQVSKTIEVQVESPNVDTNTLYQNLNAETETNKPEVVKTVIISSGVQPQFMLDTAEGTTEVQENVKVNKQNVIHCSQLPTSLESKKQISLQALATSTPHKEFSILKKIETDSSDSVSVSNDSKSECVETKESVPDKYNTQDSHDAPDVRIFVRRRRKGIKKT